MFKIPTRVAALVVAGLACLACTDGSSLKPGGGRGTGGQGDCICDFLQTGGAIGAGGTTGAGGVIGSGGASDGASTDAGQFACGDATCGPSQICLYPAYGCIGMAPPDSGICPDGWGSAPGGDGCVQSPTVPSCVSPAPGEGSFDCSGQGTSPTCRTVNAPVPSTCSRICRATCA